MTTTRGWIAGVAIAAVAAGVAHAAGTVPTPTLPTPTLTTPSLPTPTVSVPTVTVPTVSVPAPKPTVPTPTASTPTVSTPVSTPTATVAAVTTPAGTVPVATPSAPSPSRPTPKIAPVAPGQPVRPAAAATPSSPSSSGGATRTVRRMETPQRAVPTASRARATTKRQVRVSAVRVGRPLVLRFRVRARSTVVYSLIQVSPVCRHVATFRRVAHRGANTLRIGPRVARHRLARGTYRIVGRARGRLVLSRRFVVANRILPARAALEAAARTVCKPAPALAPLSSRAVTGVAVAVAAKSAAAPAEAPSPAAPKTRAHRPLGPFTPHVLGHTFTKRLEHASPWMRVALLGTLGFAIALLALAAMPLEALPDGRLAAFVAHRRLDLALAGLVLVAAVAVAVIVT